MHKIVNPCKVEFPWENGKRGYNAFAEITYNDGKLSIHGVVGPLPSGNCHGCVGQCQDEIRTGIPAAGWTQEMLTRFCDIWDEWHLNDLRPYCQHQKELGWDKQALEKVTLYHYTMKPETYRRVERMKNQVWEDAKNLGAAYLSDDQMELAKLPYNLTLSHEITEPMSWYYKPQSSLFSGMTGPTETRMLSWLHESEHPNGLLGKPCPVCGYKYGTSWQTEPIPQNVIDFLKSLPESTIKPAWI